MKNALLIVAIGGAVLLVLQKQAQAAAVSPKASSSTINAAKTVNVNSDMWSRLLGDGWRNMVGAQNADGSAAFLMKNMFGQITTSDGKPIDGGDPIAAYAQTVAGLPTAGYTDLLGSISPFDSYIDGGSEILGW
jgi:hypothetical protein